MNTRKRNTARDIAAWIARIRPRDIPRDVRARAKEHLLDGFAVMLAGADEPASRHIDDYIADIAGRSEATIIGSRRHAPVEYAALANGVRGHVLDYDDAQL